MTSNIVLGMKDSAPGKLSLQLVCMPDTHSCQLFRLTVLKLLHPSPVLLSSGG